MVAILLTGIPTGIVSGFQNYTGKTPADMLRLNLAITPAPSPTRSASRRRPGRITQRPPVDRRRRHHRAPRIAGVTYPLVHPSYKPDKAASKVSEELTPGPNRYQTTFPYLGLPHDGFDTPSS